MCIRDRSGAFIGHPAAQGRHPVSTETVCPRIASTLDAAALCKMADRGQITGGLLDGPLTFDNAISETSVASKGIVSDVAGIADILVAPDL